MSAERDLPEMLLMRVELGEIKTNEKPERALTICTVFQKMKPLWQ